MRFTAPPAAPLAGNPPVPPPPREASSIWMRDVVAPFVQNIEGGIGVAVIVCLVGFGLTPTHMATVGKVAVACGAFIFGGACAIRAFRDEIGMIVAAYAAGSLDATTEALRAENSRLLAEIERLKSEGMVAHSWGAREAAERLVSSYFAAIAANQDVRGHLARAESMQRGLSRAQWEQGVRFLQGAGVLDRGVILSGSEEAGLAAIARHAALSRVSVRAANGDMVRL